MVSFFRYCFFGTFSLALVACDQAGVSLLKATQLTPLSVASAGEGPKKTSPSPVPDLNSLIKGSRKKVRLGSDFAAVMLKAIDQDPAVLSAKNEVAVSKAKLRNTESGGDITFNATVLGGIEDITDETAGVAAILTANRLLYDGGMLASKIEADTALSKASEQAYLAMRGSRAVNLAHSWIELERYSSLKTLISSRLAVLDPLLLQLEKVASAGVGDVSQVASAQRIVSSILVAETDIISRYEQAKIAFVSDFGGLPLTVNYDPSLVTKVVPKSTVKELASNSPMLLARYWAYRAAEASVLAIQAQDEFNVGFKAQLQRPFGGSGANSDESVGLVISKNLYQGDLLESQIDQAKSTAQAKAAQVFVGYQQGERTIQTAREVIKSMDKAVVLARRNVEISREETAYLKKQLIIGGSTLESVLSAEARLYDAESQEIGFVSERRKAEATIVALTGYFETVLRSN